MSESLRKRLMLVLRIVVSVGMLALLLTKIEDQGRSAHLPPRPRLAHRRGRC